MPERLRVAIVGAGIGAAHAEGYAAHPELFELALICDADRGRAVALAGKLPGAAACAGLAEVLNRQEIDVVDICLPPFLHADAVRRALEAGKHVVCEKPLCGSLAEVDMLAALAESTGRRLMPVMQYGFGNGLRRLLHLRERGVLGRAYLATVETHWTRGPAYYAAPWRGRKATELGGALVSQAIHAHDLLMRVLGPVAEATGTTFPMALDRSGHRLAGPAISMGAKLFDAEGNPAVVDDGFRQMVEMFVAWHEDGTMAQDVWAGQGGAAYQDAAQEFINANLVYYYSGSWQVGRFEEAIGDAFDWQAVGVPCGPGGCTGMPGGAGLVGFKDTAEPEAVAEVIDFFASEDVHAELIARTKNVPAHKGLAEKGLDYPDTSAQAAAALQTFARQVPKISPIAYKLQGYALNRAIFNTIAQRVTQAIVGEMTVDEALERISADVDEAVAQSRQ